jgi:hypothetical protein
MVGVGVAALQLVQRTALAAQQVAACRVLVVHLVQQQQQQQLVAWTLVGRL